MKAILTYHSVDDSGSPISVGSDAFAGHARWLRRAGVPVVTLDTLLASSDTSTDAVAVTFDDALVTARPAIERLLGDGLPVTIFVVTGRVGQTNSWEGRPQAGIPTFDLMDWPDLDALRARGALRFSASAGRRELAHPCARTCAPFPRQRLRCSVR